MDIKGQNVLKQIRLYHILVCICVIGIASLVFISITSGVNQEAEALVPVHIIGKYSIDGQKLKELTSKIPFNSHTLHTVIFNGHFSMDIPEGMVLMLRLDNIRALIRINGEEVYRFGTEESIRDFSKTAGNAWDYYVSPGITKSDNVEIVLQNVYKDRISNVFEEFVNNIFLGHGYELYEIMKKKMPLILLGSIIFIIGTIALLICIVERVFKTPDMERGVALSCITIAGGLWILLDGGYPYSILFFKNPLLFNTIDVLQLFVIPVLFIFYVYTYLENSVSRKIAEVFGCISLVLLLTAVLMQILGIRDLLEMQDWVITWSVFILSLLILMMYYEGVVLKNKQTLVMFLSWLPLFISVFMDVANDFFGYMPRRTAIMYGFVLSVLIQFYQLIHFIRTSIKQTMRLEYELLNSRMGVMLSQIQPHFLSNTLNDIRFLYREAPEQAEKALVSFTRYLRGNMDSLNQKDLVPLMQELNHVQNYTDIEQIRFGSRLSVTFEIGSTQFFVPVLTIQPLVENAIRHGLMGKPGGGTVTVRTFEDAHDFIIEVSDDGVGYDPSAVAKDGWTHSSIENVRTRLYIMCVGRLEIMSRIGEGTSVFVHIPKERQDEDQGG